MSRIARLMPTVFLRSRVIVSDSFDRADSATTLGNADTGQAWTALAGVFGIARNQARCVSGTVNLAATVDSGLADCVITWDVPVVHKVTSSATRLVFRASDASNMLWLASRWPISFKWGIVKLEGGTATALDYCDIVANDNDTVKITLNGSSVKVSVNGTQYLDTTITFNASATKHGIGSVGGGTISRYDNFLVEAL